METIKKLLALTALLSISSCNLFEIYIDETITIQESIENKKLCLIGDTGTATPAQYLVADALKKEECDYVFHLGDIIYREGIENENDQQLESKFIKPYKDIYSKVPMFLSLGNHDHYGNERAWISTSKRIGVHLPNNFYTIKTPEVCFVAIDTFLNFNKGQEQWIKNQLINNPNNCKHQVVFGHHPYISSGAHGDAKSMIGKFLRENIIGKTKLYIAGHDHQQSIEKMQQGTHLLLSGAGAKLRPIRYKNNAIYAASKLGYMTMTLSEEKFTVLVKSVDKETTNIDFEYIVNLKD